MKRFSVVTALAMGLCLCMVAGKRIVNYPFISYTNTNIIDISRVELSDTATIVTFDATFRPKKSIKLSPDAALETNGKEYALKSSRNIVPGEKLYIPESGKASFTLIFDPLPLTTYKFDFKAGNSKGDWILADVLLNRDSSSPRPLPEGLPKGIIKDFKDGPLPAQTLSVGESTVNVHFLGGRPEFGSKLSFIIDEVVNGEKGAKMKFDKKGDATVRFTQYGPARIQIMDRNNYLPYANFSIIPGETVDCYLDGTISGSPAMRQRDPDEIPSDWYIMHNGALNNLDRMYSGMRKDYSSWLRNGEKKLYDLDRKSYMNALKTGYLATLDSISRADIPEMEKEVQTLMLRDMVLTAVGGHKNLMRYHYLTTTGRWDEPFSYDSIPATLTDEDFREVTGWFDVSDPRLLIYGTEKGIGVADWNAYGVKGDLSKSLRMLSEIRKKAGNAVLSRKDVDEMRSLSNPLFAQVADSLYAEMNRKLAALDSSVTPEAVPDVPVEQIFDAIVAPHKGKVVVVDIWNTWCAPCRRALKQNEPLKDGELSNEDIVWVYIADESSDHFQYLKMIPKIKGLHYKLTREQIEKLHKRFGVVGIPYYILVDRKGNAQGRPDLGDHSKYAKEIKSLL